MTTEKNDSMKGQQINQRITEIAELKQKILEINQLTDQLKKDKENLKEQLDQYQYFNLLAQSVIFRKVFNFNSIKYQTQGSIIKSLNIKLILLIFKLAKIISLLA